MLSSCPLKVDFVLCTDKEVEQCQQNNWQQIAYSKNIDPEIVLPPEHWWASAECSQHTIYLDQLPLHSHWQYDWGTWPVLKTEHFFGASLSFASFRRMKTIWRFPICCSNVYPGTNMSSRYTRQTASGRPVSIPFKSSWGIIKPEWHDPELP